nr:2-acylglycerol O-acyltransferase 3-like [Ovis aries]
MRYLDGIIDSMDGYVLQATRDWILSCSSPSSARLWSSWLGENSPVCPPGEHCLTLWNRKGFVRLALRHGFTQVPMYSFGYLNPDIGPRIYENGAFTVKPPAPDSWQHLFQTTFKQLMYFSPCILWGCGLFSAKS